MEASTHLGKYVCLREPSCCVRYGNWRGKTGQPCVWNRAIVGKGGCGRLHEFFFSFLLHHQLHGTKLNRGVTYLRCSRPASFRHGVALPRTSPWLNALPTPNPIPLFGLTIPLPKLQLQCLSHGILLKLSTPTLRPTSVARRIPKIA